MQRAVRAEQGRAQKVFNRGQAVELRHLKYFVAVAEELSVSRAAERLRIAQPGLSQRIRGLEAELGLRLFDRSPRGVTLTDAGTALLPEARQLLDHADRLVRLAREVARGNRVLRLSHTRSASGGTPARLISYFCRMHPDVDLKMNAGFTELNLRALSSGEIDIAFVRPSEYDDRRLRYLRVADDPVVVVLPEGHRLSRRDRLTRHDLSREPLVFFPRENGPRFWDLTMRAVFGEDPPAPSRVEPDQEFMLAAVAQSGGITLLSWSVAEILHPRGVTVRRLVDPEPTVPIELAWHSDNRKQALRDFLECTRRFLSISATDGSRSQAAGDIAAEFSHLQGSVDGFG